MSDGKNKEPIRFYESGAYALDTFAAFAVDWRGTVWMTAEHAFQAAKFHTGSFWEMEVRKARSSHEAKEIGKRYKHCRAKNWAAKKLKVMENISRAKLGQHPYIQELLLQSGEREIIEDSPTDSFWGRGPDHQGQNHLGQIWMKLRKELRKASRA